MKLENGSVLLSDVFFLVLFALTKSINIMGLNENDLHLRYSNTLTSALTNEVISIKCIQP